MDLIIHILSNLPEEYEVAVSELERKLKDDSIQLKMEDIRETLGSRYERIVKNDMARKEEIAFAAFKKQFKGLSGKYGEYGHESTECPNQEAGRAEQHKFQGTCWVCGETGHKARNCPKKKTKERSMLAYEKESDIEDYMPDDMIGIGL